MSKKVADRESSEHAQPMSKKTYKNSSSGGILQTTRAVVGSRSLPARECAATKGADGNAAA